MTKIVRAPRILLGLSAGTLVLGIALAAQTAPDRMLGAARVDVTPLEPIRLTGYAMRKAPNVGVQQKLWAKALAIGSDREGPAVLITLDNCGIAEDTWREVRSRLAKSAKLKAANIVIASSHTHSAPATKNWAPNIFVRDLTPEEQGAIDRYTADLINKLEQVALDALNHRQSGRLSWSQGTATFAKNRRTVVGRTAVFGDNPAGPVDHALPVLRAESADGRLIALVANYACHCTTLGGEFNHVCGDWAGYAQEAIERENPGAVTLITIGCGADSNPAPRGGADGGLALAKKHGEEIGDEVKRLLGLTFSPLNSRLSTEAKEIALPFGPQFTRDQWLARSTNSGIVGYHAKKWLARLDRGEKVPTSLYYPITAWNFGNDLALVFLPGEVVVDYALRLKRELDGQRLWVSGYANYVPCYIPSRRILAEGGYEAEESLWYYDRPARISTNAEDLIVRTVHGLVPKSFRAVPQKADMTAPKTPQQALGTFRTHANLSVELVASEPLTESPVTIDWDSQGRLWVCEMYDYPSGLNPPADSNRKYGEPLKEPPGGFTPGGRIKILTDGDGDGRFDKATVFLDRIPFPTGVMPWRNGALICAAPNILYAEDTNGDGRADLVRTNITGFATHNYQARVNGFVWGLDGWLHGSSGLFGGKVKCLQTGREVNLSGRDFRYQPDTGEIEPVSGISQFGRVRDDFDSWFGNDNSTWLWHYPLPDHYLRRNPHVTYPEPRVLVAGGAAANKLFPISRTLERFNDQQMVNIVTSGCGPDIYRDVLLGTNYYGNAFICEPVHNLVHRLVLAPDGVTFAGRRAVDEQRTEFLASTDNWFRPVQVRTGPDGALYVVDMYRFVVEHPRWIPPERLKRLDIRAGADMGRIYRVVPNGVKTRPLPNLDKATGDQLVEALGSPNGPTRDLAHRVILEHGLQPASTLPREGTVKRPEGRAATTALARLAGTSASPAVRAQSLSVLAGLEALSTDATTRALADTDSRVRQVSLRLSERSLVSTSVDPKLASAVLNLVTDTNPAVRLQVGFTLGEWRDSKAAEVLAELAQSGDARLRVAAVSSAAKVAPGVLRRTAEFIETDERRAVSKEAVDALIRTAVGESPASEVLASVSRLVSAGEGKTNRLGNSVYRNLFDAIDQQGHNWKDYLDSAEAASPQAVMDSRASVTLLLETVRNVRLENWTNGVIGTPLKPERLGEVFDLMFSFLGREAGSIKSDAEVLTEWLRPDAPLEIQNAAVARLRAMKTPAVAELIIAKWQTLLPSIRASLVRLLLSREDWTLEMLTAMERKNIAPSEVPLADRQRLLKSEKPSIRTRAERAFQMSASADRAGVLVRFQDVGAMSGRSEMGAAIFEKNCAQCHAMRGRGHEVGPNLAEFAGKGTQDYVLAIFDPNAGINPNFVGYNVETKDGRSLSGIVRGETASGLTLVQGGGVRETILRSDIKEIQASALSLMPEGLEQAMSPQDVADLIAWLKQGTAAQFGSATPEQAAKARAEFVKGGMNGLAQVVTSVEVLPYPSWIGRSPLAYCRQNTGQERLVWKTEVIANAGGQGRPLTPVGGEGGMHRFRLPAAMGFNSQPTGKFTLKLNGQAFLDFDVTLSDCVWESGDGRGRMSYSVLEANSEDSNGVLVIEVASSLLKRGVAAEFEVTGSSSNSQRWFGVYLLPDSAKTASR